ncbi:MAG: 50S ribosomal protein L24 [Betaproteobacteria bacterium]|nr:50S ribosomal protein L24 [Betaproteobacteria bacterium]
MEKLRKGDEVIVLTGKDRGKRGVVTRRVGAEHLLVEGVNVVKKHVRPNPMKNTTGGIESKAMPINQSNVAIFNPATQKADRVGVKTEGEKKVRIFRSNGEPLPNPNVA